MDPQLGVTANDPAMSGEDDHMLDDEQFPKHLNVDELVRISFVLGSFL